MIEYKSKKALKNQRWEDLANFKDECLDDLNQAG
jgi:hypothetical protein